MAPPCRPPDGHRRVEGIRDVQRDSEERFGPSDYRPLIPVTYWSFRYMIFFGLVTSALSLLGLWLIRKGRLPESKWFYRIALWTIPFPLIATWRVFQQRLPSSTAVDGIRGEATADSDGASWLEPVSNEQLPRRAAGGRLTVQRPQAEVVLPVELRPLSSRDH